MDRSPPGSSVHGILQERILEWVAVPSSRGCFQPKGGTLDCLLHFLHWQVNSLPLEPSGKQLRPGSVQFSCSVVSDSLQPHESQHTRPPCPSPTPEVYPNSCPSSWWYIPNISFSVGPFSSCPQSLPASWSLPMSQLFPWGGQSIGVSASASVLPMNTQDWSLLGWTGWIFLQSRDSQGSSPTPQFKSINSWVLSCFYSPTLTSIHDHWKNHGLD